MKCVICKHGETAAGLATVTLVSDSKSLVIKGLPAQVCENCGEEYVDETVAESITKMPAQAAENGS